ncbi:MAG: hypothetical protein QM764_21545 [Chitinophagaceae bacterium]
MSGYRISSDKLRLPQGGIEMLAELEKAFEKFKIDFYLVGAISRDVWFTGIHGIRPKRSTADIDFAVLIHEKGIYEELKDSLLATKKFTSSHDNAFVLIYEGGLEVDLLPFGEIEDDNRTVKIQGTGYTSIHVDGLSEVYRSGLPEVELEGHQFKFCTLPGIIILKLIAWDDRPEKRRDDIKDISEIMDHFFNMNSNDIWDNHFDLFEKEDADLREIAAEVIGRKMRKILLLDNSLFERIAGIIQRNIQQAGDSPMALIMTEYFDNTIEADIRLLEFLLKGLQG